MPSETNLHLTQVSAWQPMLHTDHDHTPALVSIRVGDPWESWVSLYAEPAELAAALRDAADEVDRLGDHAAEMVRRAEDDA